MSLNKTKYFYFFILIFLMTSLFGCTEGVNDQASQTASSNSTSGSTATGTIGNNSGTNTSPTGNQGTPDGTTINNSNQAPSSNAPPSSLDSSNTVTTGTANNGINNGSNGASNGGAAGNGNAGVGTVPPVIKILNLKGGEYIKGGTTFSIFFVVTNQYVGSNAADITLSQIEFQKPGESADTWHLIQDKIVAVSGDTTEVQWQVCSPTDSRTVCLNHQDGYGFKIRISTLGSYDLSSTAVSSAFTIDSTKPNLDTTVFSMTSVSDMAHLLPFVQINISGIKDTVTPIESICVKQSSTILPSELDSCWVKVVNLGATEALTLSSVSMTQYLGFHNLNSIYFYLWGKDKAGNISDLKEVSGKDKIIYNYTSPTANLTHGYWNDSSNGSVTGFHFATSTSSSSITTYTGDPSNNLTTLTDPGSIVVNSKGAIYIKDAVLGIVRINPITETRDVLIPLKSNITEGLLSQSTTGVKNPIRIALDTDDGLWILDESALAYVDFTAVNPELKIMAGGGTSEDDHLTDAKNLKITYHDNLRWFGTFNVMPDKTVIFHSSNPHLTLDNGTHDITLRQKLRFFNFSDKSIDTLYLSGSYTFGTDTVAVDNFYPFGPMAITFDFNQKQIKNIYGRFCKEDGAGGCTPMLLKFNEKGVVLSQMSLTQVPYLYNNSPFITQNSTLVYAFNGLKSYLSVYDDVSNNWTKIVGYIQRGTTYCDNGSSSTSCRFRMSDIYIQKSGLVYILDGTRIRVIDSDDTVQTIYEPPGS